MKISEKVYKISLIILSVISSMALLYLTDSNHLVSGLALILAPCFYFFYNRFFRWDKSSVPALIYAAIVSCALFAGKYVIDVRDTGTGNFPFHAFIYLLAFIPLIFTLECAANELLLKISLKEKRLKYEKLIFPVSAVIIAVCYIPYFLAQYPCAMTYDAIRQVNMALGNLPLTNHHPVFHTLFIKLCLWLGNGSPWVYSIIQIVIMSLIFAFCIWYIYKKTHSPALTAAVLVWFALNPLHGTYSVNMHKDIIFSGMMLLLTIAVTELALSKGNALHSKKWLAFFILSCLGVCFMRNNGPIIVFALLIICLIIYKKYYKPVLITMGIVIFTIILQKTVIFSALNVQPTHFVESVGIPLQQIARTVVDCDITDEQAEKISKYLPIEEIKEKYDPYCVDTLKSEVYGTHFNHEALESDKFGFISLWFELLAEHPVTYVKAYLDETYGYWYPFTNSYVAHWAFIADNDLGLTVQPVSDGLSKALGKVTALCFDMKIPVINILFSAAGMVYICFFFAYPARKKHGRKGLLPFLPLLLLWLTMLIAAPIATSLRYLYSAFTCLPVLAAVPLFKKND